MRSTAAVEQYLLPTREAILGEQGIIWRPIAKGTHNSRRLRKPLLGGRGEPRDWRGLVEMHPKPRLEKPCGLNSGRCGVGGYAADVSGQVPCGYGTG